VERLEPERERRADARPRVTVKARIVKLDPRRGARERQSASPQVVHAHLRYLEPQWRSP
jgi:hypothetical protein